MIRLLTRAVLYRSMIRLLTRALSYLETIQDVFLRKKIYSAGSVVD
jgi:hypothetical protein